MYISFQWPKVKCSTFCSVAQFSVIFQPLAKNKTAIYDTTVGEKFEVCIRHRQVYCVRFFFISIFFFDDALSSEYPTQHTRAQAPTHSSKVTHSFSYWILSRIAWCSPRGWELSNCCQYCSQFHILLRTYGSIDVHFPLFITLRQTSNQY